MKSFLPTDNWKRNKGHLFLWNKIFRRYVALFEIEDNKIIAILAIRRQHEGSIISFAALRGDVYALGSAGISSGEKDTPNSKNIHEP